MVETRAPGHAATLAAEAARARVPLVVAVGGDGTLNEVVNGVVPLRAEYPVAVGAIMTGRGRDACRNLGLPRDPRRAARVRVHAATPLPVQLDGELGAHTPLDVESHPGALNLLL